MREFFFFEIHLVQLTTQLIFVSQIKTDLMQCCAVFISAVTPHVSGASSHHQVCLKLVQQQLIHVLSLQVSYYITLLGPELNAFSSGPNKSM